MQSYSNKKIEAKEEIYLILAEFIKNPSEEFFLQISDGSIDKRLKELYSIADYSYPNTSSFINRFADYESFNNNYMRCFSGVIKPYALPVESVYKAWSTDPKSEMLNLKGYIFGESALHIKYLFNHYKLDIPEEYKSIPDHLTLLLELLAFLIRYRTSIEVYQLIVDHFDWLEIFMKELSNIENSSFYVDVTKLIISGTQSELLSFKSN